MGLFGTNKKEEKKKEEIPQLPLLPKLPDFQGFGDSGYGDPSEESQIHKLPSFPSGFLGTKFSQNTIKEAVTGEEKGDFSDEDADDSAEREDGDEMRMMQEPLKRPMTEEMGSRFTPSSNFSRGYAPGPVFIRVDKFEGAMEVFNEIRKKISEVEQVLDEVKRTKEKEDKELQSWETEVKSMKDQIEKVDRDIFSKV